MGIVSWLVVSILAVYSYPFSQGWTDKCHNWFGKSWCFWMGIRRHFEKKVNLPREGIIICNHASMFDIFVLASLPMPIRWISKASLQKLPFIGFAMKANNAYLLKRNKTGKDIKTLADVEKDLREGALVCIFPEGTRTRDGKLQAFKKGALHLAKNSGAMIYPVALKGTFDIAPKGAIPEKLQHDVTIKFGLPFKIQPQVSLEVATLQARTAIQKLLES